MNVQILKQQKVSRPSSGPLINEPVVVIQGALNESFFAHLPEQGIKQVVVLEGRPSLESSQGSCRQLIKRGVTPIVIADNMAGFLFYKNLVKEIWVACQFSDKQGALCEIGALILGVLGKAHKISMYGYGAQKKSHFIGNPEDIFSFKGKRVAPAKIKGYVPLMEWVDGKYWTKIYE